MILPWSSRIGNEPYILLLRLYYAVLEVGESEMEYLGYFLPWVTLIQEAMVLTRLEQQKLVDL